MKTVPGPLSNMTLTYDGIDKRTARLDSSICEGETSPEIIGAFNALESLTLAHFCAGVDIESPAYLEGFETALNAIVNQFGD